MYKRKYLKTSKLNALLNGFWTIPVNMMSDHLWDDVWTWTTAVQWSKRMNVAIFKWFPFFSYTFYFYVDKIELDSVLLYKNHPQYCLQYFLTSVVDIEGNNSMNKKLYSNPKSRNFHLKLPKFALFWMNYSLLCEINSLVKIKIYRNTGENEIAQIEWHFWKVTCRWR